MRLAGGIFSVNGILTPHENLGRWSHILVHCSLECLFPKVTGCKSNQTAFPLGSTDCCIVYPFQDYDRRLSSPLGALTMFFKIWPCFPQCLKDPRGTWENWESLSPFLPQLEVVLYMTENSKVWFYGWQRKRYNIYKFLIRLPLSEKMKEDSGPVSCFCLRGGFQGMKLPDAVF